MEKFRFWVRYGAGSNFLHSPRIEVTNKTFFLWEPSSRHHAEVLPGYAKYLLDLGYEVSVLINSHPLNRTLFEKFTHPHLKVIFMTQRQIVRFFIKNGLGKAQGILITTARKIGDQNSYAREYKLFSNRSDDQKLLLVEHDVKIPIDKKFIDSNVITINKINYQNTNTLVVNPHYFGEFSSSSCTSNLVQFVAVGLLKSGRYSMDNLIEAVKKIHQEGIYNFQIRIIGKRASIERLPKHIQKYFIFQGQISYSELYSCMEKADYLISLLDDSNQDHQRYLTTASSGSIQLSYGFIKPLIIGEKFASHYGFDRFNSIIYDKKNDLPLAIKRAIQLDKESYGLMKSKLAISSGKVYKKSLENLRCAIGDCPS